MAPRIRVTALLARDKLVGAIAAELELEVALLVSLPRPPSVVVVA